MRFRLKTVLTVALAVAATAATQARSGFSWEELEIIDRQWPEAKATTTGLRSIVLQEGRGGELPQPGERVNVLYKGMLFDGKVFDQSLDPAKPFTFRLFRSEVIQGWDEAIGMMRVGEKRLLLVPADLAYGARGRPPAIPRQTSLVFEVELLSIEPNPTATNQP